MPAPAVRAAGETLNPCKPPSPPLQPLVFTACLDGIARCWDIRTGAAVRQFGGHGAGIQDLALSPDGGMLLTGSDDHTARVFVFAQS